MENKAKTFMVTGINYDNKRVHREVVAINKKIAMAAARRTKIIRTILNIKEIKDGQSVQG